MEPMATRGTWVHLRACDGTEKEDPVASHIKFAGVLCLRQYGLRLAKPQGDIEITSQCRMDDCPGFGHFPYNKALGRAGSGIEPDRSQT